MARTCATRASMRSLVSPGGDRPSPNESAKLENILGDAKVFASLMLR